MEIPILMKLSKPLTEWEEFSFIQHNCLVISEGV